MRRGTLRDSDFTQLARAAGILQSYQIWIDDTPSLTLLEMRSKARRLKIDNDLRLIVVDYLQLMRSPEYSENRVQEISDISRSLKALARELEIPVIALSQLSRASEQRGGERKPILSDLRDSGAIEQDADLVIFIHRPEYYDREDESKRGHGGGHAGQAPQRPHRRRPAQVHPRVHPVRQPLRTGRSRSERWRAGPTVRLPLHRVRPRAPQVGGALRGVRGVERGGGGAGGRAGGGRAGAAERGRATRAHRPPGRAARLRDVATTPLARWRTGLHEFDFVLGGGIVPGLDDPDRRRAGHRQVHAAAPGRGAAGDRRAARCSTPAARSRPTRSGFGPIGCSEDAGRGARAGRDPARGDPRARPARSRADVVVIDSIQTVYTDTLESAPGNVGQVRECSGQLMRFAKESGTAVIVVGHVTKGGGIAGPKTLEHIVDTVLYFEGEATLDYRLLRTTKNRFGSVDELGVFSMTEQGLVAVPNPSAVFLAARADGISGSAVTALMEGTRPVLVEVQALAAKSGYGTPQRVATGLDPKRLAVLLAVLERRAQTSFADLDVFVQVTAGVRLTEPGADLAVAAALLSQPLQPARPRRTSSSSARSASAARSGPAARSSGGSPRRPGSGSAGCSARPGARSQVAGVSLVGLDHVEQLVRALAA